MEHVFNCTCCMCNKKVRDYTKESLLKQGWIIEDDSVYCPDCEEKTLKGLEAAFSPQWSKNGRL